MEPQNPSTEPEAKAAVPMEQVFKKSRREKLFDEPVEDFIGNFLIKKRVGVKCWGV